MEIFKTFGLDPYLTVAQIVNFIVIFYIFKRFLYPPLFRVLKKREELVKETVEKAEESRKALEKAQEEEKAIINKAHATATQIISDAKEQAGEITKKAEETAKQQADKMLNDAKSQLEQETEDAQIKLQGYVTKLSLDLLKKSLSNVFTEKEQGVIIEKAMKELQKRPN